MRRKMRWMPAVLAVACAALCFWYVYSVVMARDTTAPRISFAEETVSVSVHDWQGMLLAGVSAQDDRDGDVTVSLVVEGVSSIRADHSATVTYAAFDKAGNVAKASRTVLYTDYESPVFTLSAPLVFRGGIVPDVFSCVGAADLLDGDLTNRVKANLISENTITEIGTHQVELRVTNNMGDTVRLTVPVEVYAAGTYNATVNLSAYLIYVEAGRRFSGEEYLQSFTCGGETYAADALPGDATVTVESTVQTDVPGTYTVDYTVSYENYTGYSRLIVVVEG